MKFDLDSNLGLAIFCSKSGESGNGRKGLKKLKK